MDETALQDQHLPHRHQQSVIVWVHTVSMNGVDRLVELETFLVVVLFAFVLLKMGW